MRIIAQLLLLVLAPTSMALLYGDIKMAVVLMEMGLCNHNSSADLKLRITPKRYARALGFMRDYASILLNLFDKNISISCFAGTPLNSSCECIKDFEGDQCQKYTGDCALFDCSTTSCGYTLEDAIASVKCICSQEVTGRSKKDLAPPKADGIIAQERQINQLSFCKSQNTLRPDSSRHLKRYSYNKKKKESQPIIKNHSSSSSCQFSLNDALKALKIADYNSPVKIIARNREYNNKSLSNFDFQNDNFSHQTAAKTIIGSCRDQGLLSKSSRHQKMTATPLEDPDINIFPVNHEITFAPCTGMLCKYFLLELKSPKRKSNNVHSDNVLKRQDKLLKISPILKFLGGLQNEGITSKVDNTLPESYEEILNGVPEKYTLCPFSKTPKMKTITTTEDTFITIDIIEGVIEESTSKTTKSTSILLALQSTAKSTALPKLNSVQPLMAPKSTTEMILNISPSNGDMKVTVFPHEFSRAELLLGAFITTTVSSEKKLKWPPDIESLFRGNGSSSVALPKGVKLLAAHENVLAKLIAPMEDMKGRKYLSNQKVNKEQSLKRHNIAIFKSKTTGERMNMPEVSGDDPDQPLVGEALSSILAETKFAKVAEREGFSTANPPQEPFRNNDPFRKPNRRRMVNRNLRHPFSSGKKRIVL